MLHVCSDASSVSNFPADRCSLRQKCLVYTHEQYSVGRICPSEYHENSSTIVMTIWDMCRIGPGQNATKGGDERVTSWPLSINHKRLFDKQSKNMTSYNNEPIGGNASCTL